MITYSHKNGKKKNTICITIRIDIIKNRKDKKIYIQYFLKNNIKLFILWLFLSQYISKSTGILKIHKIQIRLNS